MQGTDMTVSNLHQLIDKKIELFMEIKRLTFVQKEDIEKNEADNIEGLVAQKQAVINRIDEIDKAFSQQFELLKKQLGLASLEDADIKRYPELGDLKEKVRRILTLAKEIMAVEQENKENINVIFNNLKTELRKINIGKKSLRAYEPPVVNNDGIYIDKKK